MKDYFKRLKDHAGLGVASMMTIMGFLAGASNASIEVWWHGGLFGLIVAGGISWGMVLFSNFK